MQKLTRYLIEMQRPTGGWEDLQQLTARTRVAAEQLRHQGKQVRFLRAVFVPEDDACFFLVEGLSTAVVRQLMEAAGLDMGSFGAGLTAVVAPERKERDQ